MTGKIQASQEKDVTKIDLRKEFKELYNPPAKEVVLVDVPDMAFLMVDGSGDPRRAAPEKLKTVLRQPVKRVS
jgi:hypothetical protein